ncbi:MAG: hydroxymethylbilane synthase [Chloroflexota bacterium]
MEIRIGTRGSALALAQASLTFAALDGAGVRARLVIVETAGDRRSPDTAWGEGAFVAAIEEELLAGRIDVAVHSAKDVPTEIDPRLRIAAYLPRADPRDALVVPAGRGRSLGDLRLGARIGTDSPRRTGFLLARRPDLDVQPIHGNVDTRLRRLDAGETDALVLACAGLDRLGLGDRIAERLDPEIVPPAPGQGALAIQVRSDDDELIATIEQIDDPATRLVVEAERAFLAASGGGCRAPIGALATIRDGELDLLGGYVAIDGSSASFAHRHGPLEGGAALAADLATTLRSTAAGRTMDLDRPHWAAPPRVLVTRTPEQAGVLIAALRRVGLDPIAVPTIDVELVPAGGGLDDALRRLGRYAWVVVTSSNGARAVLQSAVRVFTPFEASRWAAIGNATRQTLEREGVDVAFQPAKSTSAALAEELPVTVGNPILVVRGNLADADLPTVLRSRGAVVDDIVGYTTIEGPQASTGLLQRAFEEGPPDLVVFTSGSTVRGLLVLAERAAIDVLGLPAVCIGPETASAAEGAGFHVVAVSASPDAWILAQVAARAVEGPRARVAAVPVEPVVATPSGGPRR